MASHICNECERVGRLNLAHYKIDTKLKFSKGKPRTIFLCKRHLAEKTLDEINSATPIYTNADSINSVIILHQQIERTVC